MNEEVKKTAATDCTDEINSEALQQLQYGVATWKNRCDLTLICLRWLLGNPIAFANNQPI